MTEPTQEEADEALHILAGQCGNAKVRKDNRDIIMARLKNIHSAYTRCKCSSHLGVPPFKNIVPQSAYDALDRDVPPFKNYGQEPKPQKQMNNPNTHQATTAQPPDDQGGVGETLELLLEIRQARALLHSQITEQKKRTKVKIQKLNLAEVTILDAYEDHDKQLTLFDLPPVPDDVRAILDDPQI
jgi:hypothetical protein